VLAGPSASKPTYSRSTSTRVDSKDLAIKTCCARKKTKWDKEGLNPSSDKQTVADVEEKRHRGLVLPRTLPARGGNGQEDCSVHTPPLGIVYVQSQHHDS
jgi:hypothetical protein